MKTTKPIIESENTSSSKLLSATFNQDSSCFAISTENGFRVYNSDPMELKVKREFDDNGGIGLIRMLYRTNYLALIGGGRNPRFPLNKTIIWDDLKAKDALTLNFYSPILNIFLSRTRIVVVLNNKIHIHGFGSPPKAISNYETLENPLGIAALSPGIYQDQTSSSQILAFPSRIPGQIQIVDISSNGNERNLVSIVKAHKSDIRCIALNKAGTMIASASETGTIIRVHSTQTCSLLYEFRRGLDRAVVYSMEFSQNGSKLAVLSDKLTLHVFNINSQQQNKQHLLKNLPVPLKPNYFNSTWSFCSLHLNSPIDGNDDILDVNDRGVIGWSSEYSIIILWKLRAKWEKYEIIEKEVVNGDNVLKTYDLQKRGWKGFADSR
ncbi:hypothetical protein WICMUC_005811 [Wickerhamomyces mucosus]|uniref:SVP1-like protein 2 n=1 Tax=Wickerhamomyces mucosus TaxID=1378264 RepID=A0A9P8T378_9ASCO|nr:hypothetical protein WICMUC_005811 [Wickerhamomyces mucosus]